MSEQTESSGDADSSESPDLPSAANGQAPEDGQVAAAALPELEATESEDDDPIHRWRPTYLKWRPTRVLIVVGFLAMAGFWIWAFSPFPSRGHPDTFDTSDGKAFTANAEARCAATMERLDALPRDLNIDNPEQLAEQVASGTELLVPLVADLRNLARSISDPDEARIVNLWLDDWNIYIADRQSLVAKLRQGERAEFTYTARDGVQIARIVDRFAQVNDMTSCETPKDI